MKRVNLAGVVNSWNGTPVFGPDGKTVAIASQMANIVGMGKSDKPIKCLQLAQRIGKAEHIDVDHEDMKLIKQKLEQSKFDDIIVGQLLLRVEEAEEIESDAGENGKKPAEKEKTKA
jgi:hypothetical protein